MNLKKVVTLASLLMLTSCSYVTKEQFDNMRVDVEKANQQSQQALAQASEANRKSDTAMQTATSTEVIVNRSFKRSMLK